MRWFGETWDAPINDLEHADTPVGETCEHCKEPIVDDDRGVLLPGFHFDPEAVPLQVPEYAYHLRCFMATILSESTADLLMEELSIADARAGRDDDPLPPTAYPPRERQPGDPEQ